MAIKTKPKSAQVVKMSIQQEQQDYNTDVQVG
jgi:hypothetical protein